MTSPGIHEPEHLLSAATLDQHRGYRSVIEELEAIDWYNQRIDATGDEELARVLTHSRDEEKEHAVMALEWLRRHDPVLDQQLRRILFTADPLPPPENEDAAAEPVSGGLGIGDLRGASSSGGI